MANQIAANVSVEIIEQKLFSADVADEIISVLNESITEKGQAAISLSGGSTPAQVYRALATPPRVNSIDWGKVKFFLGDERWVPKTDTASNYGMAKAQLFDFIKEGSPKIFAVDTSLESPAAAAEEYEKIILKEVPLNNGVPVFDIILLGVGEDGHVASLFPGSEALNEKNRTYIATAHPADDSKRLSLTFKPLLAAKRLLFLITGAKKAEIARKVLQEDADYPACFYRSASGKITFFLDTPAGSLL